MDKRMDWWKEFFSGPVVDFVLNARDEAETHFEANFVQEALSLPEGAEVLDVPCGGGRLSLELATRGYRVTGVDLSLPLLKDARRRAGIRGLHINWHHGDMRELPWRGQFDAALCFWSSFGYFDEQGNVDFLKAVSRALKPGARFLLDTPLMETRLPEMESQQRIWWPVGDLLALEDRSFDHVNSRVESEWTFVRDGLLEKKLLSLRLYTYRELCGLLERAGFGEHQAYGTLAWEPFELGSTWLYLNTTKVSDPE